MQVREMADLIDEERASAAACLRPTVHTGREHEVIEDELTAPFEQVRQVRFPVWTLENVVLFDADHRQPAPLRGKGVPRPRLRLLLGEKLLAGILPFGERYDPRKCRCGLCCHD